MTGTDAVELLVIVGTWAMYGAAFGAVVGAIVGAVLSCCRARFKR